MQNGRNGANGLVDKLKTDAVCYFENGKKFLHGINIKDGYYQDDKPVREACGIIYLGMLKAIDSFAVICGYDSRELPDDINEYRDLIKRYPTRNGKVKKSLALAYAILHRAGYYRGETNVDAIKEGIQSARFVIEKLTGKRIG